MYSFPFYGLIKISIAPLYEQASHCAELGTQAMMGTLVSLLDETTDWFQVCLPDGYQAWCEKETIVPVKILAEYEARTKLVFTARFGIGFQNEDLSHPITDLYAGCELFLIGQNQTTFKASLPDGKTIYISAEQAMEKEQWRKSRKQTADEIIKTSLSYIGTSYLWGGTSPAGLDCSGFTKLVYAQHAIELKRNASQQCINGFQLDISEGYNQLQAGDLIFFAKNATGADREKITHVGISLGGANYIHASAFVRINSLEPGAENYHPRAERLVRACRMIV